MKYARTKAIKQAFRDYEHSTAHHLNDVYANCSYAKQSAWHYCQRLRDDYYGEELKVVGYNSQTFSAGFIGIIDDRKAFVWITKAYDRYIFLDEI